MAFRRFVLEPSAEVAAEMLHPRIGWTVSRLLEHLDTARDYVALVGPPHCGKTQLAAAVARASRGRLICDWPDDAGQPAPPNPPSPVFERQIQFLDRRTRLLAEREWPDLDVPAVSDFYFDQCLAYASRELADTQYQAFVAAWSAARSQIVFPKLLVVVDSASFASSIAAIAPSPLSRQLLALAQRPGLGPVLYVGELDWPDQIEEITAAISAMR